MLRLTETYTLYIYRKFSVKYTPMHASKKEIKKKNTRVFLGAWMDLPHTLQDVLSGGIKRSSGGKSEQ